MTNGEQGVATKKKGLSPLAWTGIGCTVLLLIGVVAAVSLVGFGVKKAKDFAEEMQENPGKTAAETLVRFNPDLELIESDGDAGTITFRNLKSGEEMTLNYEDLNEGRFSMTSDEGEFSIDASSAADGGGVTIKGPEGETRIGGAQGLDDVPDWVPLYPEASATQGTYFARSDEADAGAVTSKTGDGAKEVIEYYQKKLEDEGYKVRFQTMSFGSEGPQGTVMGEKGPRTVNVVVSTDKGETQVMINYNEKKN